MPGLSPGAARLASAMTTFGMKIRELLAGGHAIARAPMQNERMAVVIELRRPGTDGKVRLLHPRPDRERWRLIRLAHKGRCERGLSYRATQRWLEQQGAVVSLGQVYSYVRAYVCAECIEQPPGSQRIEQDGQAGG